MTQRIPGIIRNMKTGRRPDSEPKTTTERARNNKNRRRSGGGRRRRKEKRTGASFQCASTNFKSVNCENFRPTTSLTWRHLILMSRPPDDRNDNRDRYKPHEALVIFYRWCIWSCLSSSRVRLWTTEKLNKQPIAELIATFSSTCQRPD